MQGSEFFTSKKIAIKRKSLLEKSAKLGNLNLTHKLKKVGRGKYVLFPLSGRI
jgi:ribosomal protein S6